MGLVGRIATPPVESAPVGDPCARTRGPPESKLHIVSPVRASTARTVPSNSDTSNGSWWWCVASAAKRRPPG